MTWKSLQDLKTVIERRHECQAVHSVSCPVQELIGKGTVWKGEVEVFLLIGHLKAKRCFGWLCHGGDPANPDRYVTILEVPPIDSPLAAIHADVAANPRV